MPNSPRDQVKVHLEAEPATKARLLPEDEPYRIALLGDFSGRSDRGPLSERKPLLIDRDNFDAVLKKLDVGIELPSGRLAIHDMDDFHPDRIYGSYPIFEQFRDAREQLSDPSTFADAAEDLTGARPQPVRTASGRSVLAEIMGDSGAAAQPARTDKLQQFVENVTKPHLAEKQDPRAPKLIGKVDQAAGQLMSAVLHHSKFRAIEGAWRVLARVVRELETGTDLKVYVLDLTKEEAASHPEQIYKMLAERAETWNVIAGDYPFGRNDADLLRMLGILARKLGGTFIGQADVSLLDQSDEWNAVRRNPEAHHVGLALPRVLMRLPYGEKTSACESFHYEEATGPKPDPKEMLYGSPALLCAMLLAAGTRDVTGLPVYVYEDDGESKAFPCAEVALSQKTAEALIENGFIPMAAIRDQDVVRAACLQSVTGTQLVGRTIQ